MFAVQRVKMRRIVVAKMQANADAEESTEFRHRGSALSASRQASIPQQVYCEFQVQGIGAKVDIIVPGYGSVGSYMHSLEISRLVPKFEPALSGEMQQVNLTGDAICISKPDAVACSWMYFGWSNQL